MTGSRLIRVPGPDGSSLKYGIDPTTLSVTPEGVVRYVIVASSADVHSVVGTLSEAKVE